MDTDPFLPLDQWEHPDSITTGSDLIAHSSVTPAWHPGAQAVAMNGMTHALTYLENHLNSNGLFTTPTTVRFTLNVAVPFPGPAFINPFVTQLFPPVVQDAPPDQAALPDYAALLNEQASSSALSFSPLVDDVPSGQDTPLGFMDAEALQRFENQCMIKLFSFGFYDAKANT